MSLSVVGNRDAEASAEAETKSPTEHAIDQFYKLIKESLGLLGGNDQTADVMKIDRGDLTRALKRNGRYLTVDHIMRLGAELLEHGQDVAQRERNKEAAQRIAVAFVAPFDLLVMTRTQMTAAEMEDRLMAWLRQHPNGEQLIWEALGPIDPRVQTTPAERVSRLKAYILRFPSGEERLREALATPAPVGTAV